MYKFNIHPFIYMNHMRKIVCSMKKSCNRLSSLRVGTATSIELLLLNTLIFAFNSTKIKNRI